MKLKMADHMHNEMEPSQGTTHIGELVHPEMLPCAEQNQIPQLAEWSTSSLRKRVPRVTLSRCPVHLLLHARMLRVGEKAWVRDEEVQQLAVLIGCVYIRTAKVIKIMATL